MHLFSHARRLGSAARSEPGSQPHRVPAEPHARPLRGLPLHPQDRPQPQQGGLRHAQDVSREQVGPLPPAVGRPLPQRDARPHQGATHRHAAPTPSQRQRQHAQRRQGRRHQQPHRAGSPRHFPQPPYGQGSIKIITMIDVSQTHYL